MMSWLIHLKQHWQISKNWQLLYLGIGVLAPFYLGVKIGIAVFNGSKLLSLAVGLLIGYAILRLCKFFIFKLESKWIVKQRWEMIRIFIIFAITGSSSLLVGRPIIKWLGISLDAFNPFVYWGLFLGVSLIFYQILLMFWAFVLGQFDFFWNFEKKMLRRMGLGIFLNN